MSSGEYEIRPVLRGDFPRGADLLRHLTRADSSWNRDYLTWKYLDNPFVERPLGIVAVTGREVMGFRGYYATPWQAASGYAQSRWSFEPAHVVGITDATGSSDPFD